MKTVIDKAAADRDKTLASGCGGITVVSGDIAKLLGNSANTMFARFRTRHAPNDSALNVDGYTTRCISSRKSGMECLRYHGQKLWNPSSFEIILDELKAPLKSPPICEQLRDLFHHHSTQVFFS